jgi:DNA-binding CsgD family transcriptional regulator
MRFLKLFKTKKKKTASKHNKQKNTNKQKSSSSVNRLAKKTDRLTHQLDTVNIAIKHLQQKSETHDELINTNSQKLQSLEQRLTVNQPINPPAESINQQQPVLNTVFNQNQPTGESKMDISTFTPQEKRLLSVFFDNRDMHLSYRDIGKTLGKSPHTVKNQLRQIRMKADLFDQSITDKSRKRFKLKDNLKIQNFLDINPSKTAYNPD